MTSEYGSRGAGVDLVVDQVVQLHHVHHAHSDLVGEALAGTPVEEARLAVGRQGGLGEQLEDLLLRRAVEHRRGHVNAAGRLARQLDHVALVQGVDEVADVLRGIQLLQRLAQLAASCRPFSSIA